MTGFAMKNAMWTLFALCYWAVDASVLPLAGDASEANHILPAHQAAFRGEVTLQDLEDMNRVAVASWLSDFSVSHDLHVGFLILTETCADKIEHSSGVSQSVQLGVQIGVQINPRGQETPKT